MSVKKSKKIKKSKDEPTKSSAASDHVDEIVSRVGQKLLSLRSEQGLSLQQLAAKSDVSGPAIHKIERSGMVPTITTLLKLSNALGVPANFFVEEGESSQEPIKYTSKDDRGIVFTPHKGLDLEGITGPYQNFRSAAAIAYMHPKASSGGKLLKHPGEELVYVTSGEVCFHLGGKEYILKAGDSLHFNGSIPHQWAKIGRASCRARVSSPV